MTSYHYKGALIRVMPDGRARLEINGPGGRYRRRFPTEAQARTAAAALEGEIQADTPLSAAELLDTRRAREILPPDVTVLEAARYYVEQHRGVTRPTTLPEAVAAFLTDCQARGLRQRSLDDKRARCSRFAASYPDMGAHEVDADLVASWLSRTASGTTRNNYRRALHTFFAWCVRAGMAMNNPVGAVATVRVEDDVPGVFAVGDVARFMAHVAAANPPLVGYYALGFFAGVRSSELAGLLPGDLRDGAVYIEARVAKARARRVIEMQPNLRAWLDAYPVGDRVRPQSMPVFRRQHRKLVTGAGVDWVHNGMRHSFATYLLARDRNADRVAHDLGHPDTRLLLTVYRGLATVEQGTAYFDIVPPNH